MFASILSLFVLTSSNTFYFNKGDHIPSDWVSITGKDCMMHNVSFLFGTKVMIKDGEAIAINQAGYAIAIGAIPKDEAVVVVQGSMENCNIDIEWPK